MGAHKAMIFVPMKYFGEVTNLVNRALPRLQDMPLVKKFDACFEEVVECEHGLHLDRLRGDAVSVNEFVSLARALSGVAISTHEEDGLIYPYMSLRITESQALVLDITSQGLVADLI